jgi:putative ABC transport system permease protein
VIRGRTFSAEEDLPHGPLVAVIGEGLWKRRFAGDPNVIEKTISLSGDCYVIIGIVGSNFNTTQFGPALEVWTAFQLIPKLPTRASTSWLRVD